jgi:hypothetical protein
VFVDDFERDAPRGRFLDVYGERWDVYPDGWSDTTGTGMYSQSRVMSVQDGRLDYFVHTEDGTPYVAALMPRLPTYGQLYGRYSVRFRADSVPGYKLAFLLWPDSEDWNDGEIDMPEGDLGDTIHGYSHCVGNPMENCLAVETGVSFDDWHVATVEWLQGRTTFYLDGASIGETTDGVPSTSMHWVLQVETSLEGPPPAPDAAGHVQVDWVAAWRRL